MMNKELETNNLLYLLILLVSFLITLSKPVSAEFHLFAFYCKDGANYTSNSTFEKNLNNHLLPGLTIRAEVSTFSDYGVGLGTDDAINGLYYCRGDLNKQECHSCISQAANMITAKCQTEKEAIIWYEECMLRYAPRRIYSYQEETPIYWDYSKTNVSDPVQFRLVLVKTMDDLVEQAAYNKTINGYAIGEANVTMVESVYFHLQCTPDILGSRCERCLRTALSYMAACCGTQATYFKMQLPSCQVRYDHKPFLWPDGAPPPALPPSSPATTPTPQPAKGGSAGRMISSYVDLFMFGLLLALSILCI